MKITPYSILKGIRYLKHYGIKDFWIRLTERMEPEAVPYPAFLENYLPSLEELNKQRQIQRKWKEPLLISVVVPAYNTPEIFFNQMIESMLSQTYENWELCIADGSGDDKVQDILASRYKNEKRIRYCHLKENLGIAENTNAALKMAAGDYIGLLDHDDILAPDALFEIAGTIRKNKQEHHWPEIDVIYTDEDKVTTDLKEYFQPHLKPDFSLDLLRSNNYITHFFLVSRRILKKTGGFIKAFEGAQDYDFIFRCTEAADNICHIPKILYHWRVHKESTADNPASKQYAFDAGRRAIEAHLKRCKQEARVEQTKDPGFYRVRYRVQGEPLISIVIPNKDEADTLKQCLESIEKSTYKNYEIIIVENNSVQERTFQLYRQLTGDEKMKVQVFYWKKEFNYAAINNYGVSQAKGEYIVLLNNDIKMITAAWMEELLANCQRKEVGIIGAKLYYPDNTIQHAGTVLGIGGIAGHVFVGMKKEYSGYFHKASIQLNYSAVTAACLMVKKSIYQGVNGMDEKFTVAFNDVDFCLRVQREGYLVVYTPFVEAYHYESKSRGHEDSKDKVRRFQNEIELMRERWIEVLKNGDPYYNKNLSLSKWNYSLKAK